MRSEKISSEHPLHLQQWKDIPEPPFLPEDIENVGEEEDRDDAQTNPVDHLVVVEALRHVAVSRTIVPPSDFPRELAQIHSLAIPDHRGHHWEG